MSQDTVERWDTHEIAFKATNHYENPFQDVELKAQFTHPEKGKELTVDGFYDGNSTWKIRFMPTEPGTWKYCTQSKDSGLNKKEGTVRAVQPEKPYLHGPLNMDGFHFRHADGTRRFLISTRFTCQFAPSSVWEKIIPFLKESRINRVFFMMGGRFGTVKDLYGKGEDFSRYNLEKFRSIDAFIDTFRCHDILVSPYFYYFNDGVQCKMSLEEDRSFIRYGMARFGAYCNVMPVLSNQVEGKDPHVSDQYTPESHRWANEIGSYLAQKAVFGVPVSVHNPSETDRAINPSYHTILQDWQFPWAQFMLRQMQIGALGSAETLSDSLPEQHYTRGVPCGPHICEGFYNPRSFARQNKILIDLRRFGIPVINEEPGYEMKGGGGSSKELTYRTWNSQTSESLLNTFWTGLTAGAYFMWGHPETYELGDPLAGMQNSVTPQYMKILHDFVIELPYWEMEPVNEVVSVNEVSIGGVPYRTNFCLAKPGKVYLIFSLFGGSGSVTLASKNSYKITRLNPRTGDRHTLATTTEKKIEFSLPHGEWVLLCQKV